MQKGYKQLEWVESSGTQYILTDIIPDKNWAFYVDFITYDKVSTSSFGCVFGARNSSGLNDYQLTSYSSNGYSGSLRTGNTSTPQLGLVKGQRVKYSLQNGVVTKPNGQKETVQFLQSAPSSPISIFALNEEDARSQFGKVRLYELIMSDLSHTISLIPAMRESDNVVGLYDLTNNKFLIPSGGTLIAGEVVNQQYLNQDGLSFFWEKIKEQLTMQAKFVSNSLVTIADAAAMPVKSLLVNIEPIQSGTGDPSPTNIRPISGWNEVNATVTGKNLFPRPVKGSYLGITYSYTNDGGIKMQGTSTGLSFKETVGHLKAGTYTISGGRSSVFTVSLVSIDGTTTLRSSSGTSRTFTLTEDTDVRFRVRAAIDSGTTVNTIIYPSLVIGNASEFQPYKGTVYSVALPNATYGGTLDIATGELKVDRKLIDLGTLNWRYLSSEQRFMTTDLQKEIINATNWMIDSPPLQCSAYKYGAVTAGQGTKDLIIGLYNKNIYLRNLGYTNAASLQNALNGIQLVYKLATPTVYHLAPIEVNTILGYNNIYADAGMVDVDYYKYNSASMNEGFMSTTDKAKLNNLRLSTLQVKEYQGLIGSQNNVDDASFYFGNVIPDDYYKQCMIKFRITASVPDQALYSQTSEVTLYIDRSNLRTYQSLNANTGTRSYYYTNVYMATAAGATTYGHALGVGLRLSSQPVHPDYARTFRIELLDYKNCTVTLWNTALKYAMIPGSGNTNYSNLIEIDAHSNGYHETGGNNFDRILIPSFAPRAGSNGLHPYTLFMQDSNGTFQSIAIPIDGTSPIDYKKNPVGFIPGEIWFLYTDLTTTRGSTAPAETAYLSFPLNVRHSIKNNAEIIPQKPFYLVGTINSKNGLFYLDNQWWAQELPTTMDGKIYMYLGMAYHKNNIHLASDHPMYWYRAGAVRLWPDGLDVFSSLVTGVKGAAEATWRVGNVELSPKNIGAVNKAGDTLSGNLTIQSDEGYSTFVKVGHNDHHVSLYASDDYVGLYSVDLPGMIIYQDTAATETGDRQRRPVATITANGFMSYKDKVKLNSIAEGAQVNTITGVKGNAESTYRTGRINLTPSNIGALPLTGGTISGSVHVNHFLVAQDVAHFYETVLIGPKTGYTDGLAGVELAKNGNIFLQNATSDPTISFFIGNNTAASAQLYFSGAVGKLRSNVGFRAPQIYIDDAKLSYDSTDGLLKSAKVVAAPSLRVTAGGESLRGLYDSDRAQWIIGWNPNYNQNFIQGDLNVSGDIKTNGSLLQRIGFSAAQGETKTQIQHGTTLQNLLTTGIKLAANHRYYIHYTVQWSAHAQGRRKTSIKIGTEDVGAMATDIQQAVTVTDVVTVCQGTYWIPANSSTRTLQITGYQTSGTQLSAVVRYQLIDFGQ